MPRPKATPRPATTYTVEIPGWLPPSLNVLLRLHWARRHRLMTSDAMVLACYCRLALVPEAASKRRVTIRLTLPPRCRQRDEDNSYKSILDALTKAGMLVDDGPDWLELGGLVQERGPRRKTTIFLEDLPCE